MRSQFCNKSVLLENFPVSLAKINIQKHFIGNVSDRLQNVLKMRFAFKDFYFDRTEIGTF